MENIYVEHINFDFPRRYFLQWKKISQRLYETQEDAYKELSHNDTLSRIQVEYDTENSRKWNGQML